MKCMFDDGEKATVKVKTEDPDHPWSNICILHYMTFCDGKKPDFEYKMVRGIPEPPKTNRNLNHQWERKYLVGIQGPWQCDVCKLAIEEGGLTQPSPSMYGGCVGEPIDWKKYKLRDVAEIKWSSDST